MPWHEHRFHCSDVTPACDPGEAKNARGALKTLTLKVDTFKQLAAKLEGANKRDADVQLSSAQRALREAEKDGSALAALQAKAEKNLAAIKKPK